MRGYADDFWLKFDLADFDRSQRLRYFYNAVK